MKYFTPKLFQRLQDLSSDAFMDAADAAWEAAALRYRLTAVPFIERAAFESRGSADPVLWMYDEIGAVRGQDSCWSHSILLSNGWEVRLHGRDVKVQEIRTLLPGSNPGVASSTVNGSTARRHSTG